jgi:hypothetical protein
MDDAGRAPGTIEGVLHPFHDGTEGRHRVWIGGRLAEDQVCHDPGDDGDGFGRNGGGETPSSGYVADPSPHHGVRGTHTPQTNAPASGLRMVPWADRTSVRLGGKNGEMRNRGMWGVVGFVVLAAS